MPKVSIIVTTYNVQDYVRQSLESVANQTLQDIEVIVVDDGSTDSTPTLIREFADQDPRFVPILLPDNTPGGVATAANAGLERATGEWVGFVDGDDFIEPEMFENLVQAATIGGTDLAMCQYQEADEVTGQRNDPADAHRWAATDQPTYQLNPSNRPTFLRFIAVPWRKLYRRELLEENKIRFPEGDYFFEDNPFHWFSIVSAKSIALVPSVLAYHRVARAGQTMATADERLFRIFQHHDTIHDWLQDRGVLDPYKTTLLTWVVSQLEWISRRTPEELRGDLFDAVHPIVARYDLPTLIRALNEGNKGDATRRLCLTLAKGDRGAFAKVLAGRPDTSNVLRVGWHHLRYSGVRKTASMTRKYTQQRLAASSIPVPSQVLKQQRSVKNSDLLFSMAVLQQQLQDVQERLDRIESAQRAGTDDRPA